MVYHSGYDNTQWVLYRDRDGPMRDVIKRNISVRNNLNSSPHELTCDGCTYLQMKGIYTICCGWYRYYHPYTSGAKGTLLIWVKLYISNPPRYRGHQKRRQMTPLPRGGYT